MSTFAKTTGEDQPRPEELLYINPLTDYGFKRIFGDEEVMTTFLNDLLEPEPPIVKVEFINQNKEGQNIYERGVIYDLRCKTDAGEFIVEMQKSGQAFFADRILYYLARSIAPQGYKGKDEEQVSNWNYRLKPVFGVFFLNFYLAGLPPCALRKVQFTVNGTPQVFSDKVTAYTIELPHYREKKEEDCHTILDYWSYIMTHMEEMTKPMPFTAERPIFSKMADIASISKLSSDEFRDYLDSLDAYRTTKAAMDFQYQEGRAEGEIKKALQIAASLKAMGLSEEQIQQATNLTIEQIRALN